MVDSHKISCFTILKISRMIYKDNDNVMAFMIIWTNIYCLLFIKYHIYMLCNLSNLIDTILKQEHYYYPHFKDLKKGREGGLELFQYHPIFKSKTMIYSHHLIYVSKEIFCLWRIILFFFYFLIPYPEMTEYLNHMYST